MAAHPPCVDGADVRPPHAVVLAGGEEDVHPLPCTLSGADLVIAADSGLALADELGLTVDLVVGDLDSVEPARLDRARRSGVRVERHSTDKDRTDLAIALDTARDHGARSLTVVGGAGGRLDHLLAVPALLASEAYAELTITAVMGRAITSVVRGRRTLHGRSGELVGLIAVHGHACGVTTRGLRYPLDDEVLAAGSSRGVSNVFEDGAATVSVDVGVLLAVQPGARQHA